MNIDGVTIPVIVGSIVGQDTDLRRLTFKVSESRPFPNDAVVRSATLMYGHDYENLMELIANYKNQILALEKKIAEAKK